MQHINCKDKHTCIRDFFIIIIIKIHNEIKNKAKKITLTNPTYVTPEIYNTINKEIHNTYTL